MSDRVRTQSVEFSQDCPNCVVTPTGYEFCDAHLAALRRERENNDRSVSSPAAPVEPPVLNAVVNLVNEQAEDEALWFEAQTMPEAYLQQELRRLQSSLVALREGKVARPTRRVSPAKGQRDVLAERHQLALGVKVRHAPVRRDGLDSVDRPAVVLGLRDDADEPRATEGNCARLPRFEAFEIQRVQRRRQGHRRG